MSESGKSSAPTRRGKGLLGPGCSILSAVMFFAAIPGVAQIPERLERVEPVKLESMTPELDPGTGSNSRLSGRIEDVFNPEALAIPSHGFSRVYEIGAELYKDGDFQRAMNAFELALLRAMQYGPGDQRTIQARKAIESVKPHLSMAARLGYKTDNASKNALTGKVERVFTPSLAWLSGLKSDDRILKADVHNNLVTLRVQRNQKTYTLRLKLENENSIDGLKAMKGKTDRSISFQSARIEHPELLIEAEKLLAHYDCAILVDCSGSMSSGMRIADGGPLGSRFDWCRDQSVAFYETVSRYFPQGFMLVPFNHNFSVARHAKAPEITEVFQKLKPSGGTDIAAPLNYVVEDYFSRRKKGRVRPLAIAVLTDGEVGLTHVRDVILNATQQMVHPREIVITFLSIGNSNRGSPILQALDDDMLDAGAAYDIVDTRYFDEIVKFGLRRVIVAALIEHRVETK